MASGFTQLESNDSTKPDKAEPATFISNIYGYSNKSVRNLLPILPFLMEIPLFCDIYFIDTNSRQISQKNMLVKTICS